MQERQERQAWSLGLEGEPGGQHGTHSAILPLTEHMCIHPTRTRGAMTLNASRGVTCLGTSRSLSRHISGPHPQGGWFSGSWLDQRTCFSIRLPSDANADGLRTTLSCRKVGVFWDDWLWGRQERTLVGGCFVWIIFDVDIGLFFLHVPSHR